MDDFNKKLKNKIYYLENRKSLIKKQIIYNNKNSEHIKEYQEQYRNGNLEYIRKLNRDNMRTKDKTELMLQRYKNICKKLGLICEIDSEIYRSILDYLGNECAFCNKTENLGLTFIIPYSKGGNMIYGNVVCCCQYHRRSKNNRLISEWNQYDAFEKLHPEKANKLEEYMSGKWNDINDDKTE